ncbi:MAG: RHS repeat protein [Acidobacteria bacterium]|nr:RHS repeat protein [Acidobacteriota bacterium]
MKSLFIGRLRYVPIPVLAALLTVCLFAETVRYSYDQAGRLIKAEYENGRTIQYVYDKAGNLLQRMISGAVGICAHVASDDFWTTRIGLINTSDLDSPVLFEAIDADGNLVETYTLASLPPAASFDSDVAAIFSPLAFEQDIWVQVSSNTDLKGVMVFGTRDEQTMVTIPIFAAGARDLIFPYVISLYPWYTGITLINSGPLPAQATLHAYDEAGNLLETHALPDPIPPSGKYVRLVDFIFPTADPAQIRSIRVESDISLIGFELFGNWEQLGLAGLPAFSPSTQLFKHRISKNNGYHVFYNEIPDNGFYYTGATFSNLGSLTTTAHLTLFDAAGNILAEADWPVIAGQQITREIWALFDDTVYDQARHFQVSSPERIMGFELYLTRDPGAAPFQFDGIIGMTEGASRLYFPLVQSGLDWSTAVRLTNLTTDAAAFTIHAFDQNGNPQGTHTGDMTGRGQFSGFLADLFPGTISQITWFYVTSDQTIIGDAFYIHTDLTRLSSYMGLAGKTGQ